jgi:hypothetical protein
VDPKVYIFFDERYEHDDTFISLVVSTILVSQSAYDVDAANAKFQSKKTRLAEINEFLTRHGGYAHLGTARIRGEDFDSDEIDQYADIKMKRRDNLWSLIVSLTICDLIAKTIASGESIQIIDIYHDPKSLRLEHADAWKNAITDRMVRTGNELVRQKRGNQMTEFSIRNFRQVGKQVTGSRGDKFQRGVWMADQLARNKEFVTSGQFSTISSQDFSTCIEEILRGG